MIAGFVFLGVVLLCCAATCATLAKDAWDEDVWTVAVAMGLLAAVLLIAAARTFYGITQLYLPADL